MSNHILKTIGKQQWLLCLQQLSGNSSDGNAVNKSKTTYYYSKPVYND